MNRQKRVALLAAILVILLLIVWGALVLLQPRAPAPIVVPPTPLASVSNTTADALQREQIPERDLAKVVPVLRKDLALLTPVPTPLPPTRRAGDKDTFFVMKDASTGTYRIVTATLQIVTPHSYFWLEDGLPLDQTALEKSADYFEKSIYPTNHQFFGSESSPGPDGDVHIHVLTTRFDQAAGYFSSEDTYLRSLVPYSNQRNMIYMNIDVRLGSNEYLGDLAHEFQHLIHNYQALYKVGWIDEGMSELAIRLNGFDVGGVLRLFARNPDTQLNTWAVDPQASGAHYAGSYLFFAYTAGRFGPDFTRAVIRAPREGVNGIQAVLDERLNGMKFDDLFADWAVSNYVNDPKVENGRFANAHEKTFHIQNEPSLSQYPISRTMTIHEYGSNYFSLQPSSSKVTVYFTGTTTAHLIPLGAPDGRWMWYSNRADLMDSTLTRELDLTKVNKATLQFKAWYDIETDFDYAYVEVSADGGRTYDILSGRSTVTSNPNGASYGPAFTGRSGVGDSNSREPAMTCTSMRRTPSRAACCATASLTSKWRRESSTGA